MLADEIEENRRRNRNAKACDALLGLLRLHHETSIAPAVNVEAIQEPIAPVAEQEHPKPEPVVEATPVVEIDWVARQKEIWFSIEERAPLRIEGIMAEVAKEYSVTRRDLMSAKRTKNIAFPRQIAMYLSKTMLGKSFPEIGRRFGGRDHTTVLHGVRKIEQLVATDANLSAQVQALTSRLSA